jgi:hypothetical protein
MRMLTIVTPELVEIGKVEAAELDVFLASRALAAEPLGSDRWVAGTQEAMRWVELVLGDHVKKVKWRGDGRMVEDVERMLREEEAAAFVARPRVMRHFFNMSGFCRAMKEVTGALPQAEVVVPPGMYGANGMHMVVWRQKGVK